MEYTHILFRLSNGSVIKKEIDRFFNLAVIYKNDFSKKFYGLNMGISIKHNNQEDADEFYKEFFSAKDKNGEIKLHACGDDGTKIPLIYCDGNAYIPEMGTSCIFAYISPEELGLDDPPPHPSKYTKTIGTVPLCGKFGRYKD